MNRKVKRHFPNDSNLRLPTSLQNRFEGLKLMTWDDSTMTLWITVVVPKVMIAIVQIWLGVLINQRASPETCLIPKPNQLKSKLYQYAKKGENYFIGRLIAREIT